MKFEKGNKLAKGGRRNPPGGRPTKEQARQRALERETAESIIKKNAAMLARRLVKDAMTEKGRRSLHVAIHKILPAARQEIEVTAKLQSEADIKAHREVLNALMRTKEGREASEASARAMLAQMNGDPNAAALILEARRLELRALEKIPATED